MNIGDKPKLKKETITYALISKPLDSVAKRLDDEQLNQFIDAWNYSIYKGPTKYYARYRITLHFAGDSTLNFVTSGDLIKTKNAEGYPVGNSAFFEQLWMNAH
jgi:hypothetical protein